MSAPAVRSAPPPRRRPPGRYDEPSRVVQRSMAVLLSVLFLGLLAAIGFSLFTRYATGQVSVQERGFAVLSDQAVRVDVTVSPPDGRTAWCLVRARGGDGAEVGAVYVPVTPEDGEDAVRLSHRLATTARAVTGEVPRCTLTRPPAGTRTERPSP